MVLSYSKYNPETGYYDYNPSDGTSNVYKNLTFEITEFEVTPYTKSIT